MGISNDIQLRVRQDDTTHETEGGAMAETIRLAIDGRTMEAERGRSVQEILREHWPEMRERAVAVRVGGTVKSLRWQPQQDCDCALLTYQNEEGRRVYERSARFVFLMAVRDVMPGARVRIENSAGYGVYAVITGEGALSGFRVRRIEQRMREIVLADLPFERTRVTREEAIAYFERDGQLDKVRLLRYRPYSYFDLYECGGMKEYFYGEMLPSTGYVRHFSLQFNLPGVVLQLPAPEQPLRTAPYVERPKLQRTFAEAAQWCELLSCSNAADLNDLIDRGELREFIRVNEALQEKCIAEAADRIAEKRARLVLIAGPSSSGKTTFSRRLAIQLRLSGLHPVSISLDNYYLDREKVPLGPDGQPDLECLESLDVPLFNEQLVRLLQGDEVEIPDFSFKTKQRKPTGIPLRVKEDQPIIVEGIHGLNDRLTCEIPGKLKYKIYISALTQLNLDDHNRIRTTDVRLLRRLVRDYQFRHSSVDRTMDMWDAVRAGESKHIFPFQEEADLMFNSSLHYELAILKKYAYPLLAGVPEDSRWYPRALRMMRFLNYFKTADVEDEIPPTSILREFIGGCTFYLP